MDHEDFRALLSEILIRHPEIATHIADQANQREYSRLWFDQLAKHSLADCRQAVVEVKIPFHTSEYPATIADRAIQIHSERLRPIEPACFRKSSVRCLHCLDSHSGYTTVWSREAQRFFHMNFMDGFPPDARKQLKESLRRDHATKSINVVCSCDNRGAKYKREADSGINSSQKRLVFDSKSQCLWGHGLGKNLVSWLKKNPNWNSNEIVWEQHSYAGNC